LFPVREQTYNEPVPTQSLWRAAICLRGCVLPDVLTEAPRSTWDCVAKSPQGLGLLDRTARTMNRIPRCLIAALAVALLVPLAWFYRVQELRLLEEQLQAIVQLKVDEVAAWRAECLADAAVLMEDPFFLEHNVACRAAPQAEISEPILTGFRSSARVLPVQGVLLVNAEARRV